MKAMKVMIWKELRENAKWAILAALGFAILCIAKAQRTDYSHDADLMKAMLSWTIIGAPLIGFALGLLQIVPELRRDQWAFLVHRPVSRTRIFFGKVCAGVGLYFLAVGVPFAIAVAWIATPGRVAAPFVSGLILPGIADILAGFLFYFAAMLTALRPARWYGSRMLGFVAALGAFDIICGGPLFGVALGAILVSTGVMLAAAWGSFVASGDYGSQPRFGRLSLGLVLCAGIYPLLVVGAIAGMGSSRYLSGGSQIYGVDQSGRIVRVSFTDNGASTITDLQGNPTAAKSDSHGAFDGGFMGLSPLVETPSVNTAYHSGGYQFFSADEGDTKARWYYDAANRGRLQGYSLRDRRFIGSLGPNGFSRTANGPGFTSWANEIRAADGMFGQLFRSGNTLYTKDLGQAKVRPYLSVLEPVLGAGIVNVPVENGAPVDVSIMIVTRHKITCFNLNGSVRFRTPTAFDTDMYNFIQAGKLMGKEHYFFRYSGGNVPEYIVETDGKGTEIARHVLPSLPHRLEVNAVTSMVTFGVVTPLALSIGFHAASLAPRYDGGLGRALWLEMSKGLNLWWPFAVSAAAGLVSALCAYFIGLRCGWDRKGRLAWAFGIFWLGIPGLLMLLALDRWPARETCPVCGRKRVVTRETCEHCGAAWPAPQRNGTEIIEVEAAA